MNAERKGTYGRRGAQTLRPVGVGGIERDPELRTLGLNCNGTCVSAGSIGFNPVKEKIVFQLNCFKNGQKVWE